MANTKENRIKKDNCRQLYLTMDKSPEDLSALTGIGIRTIEGWIRKEKWDDLKKESANIEKQIELNSYVALNKGLKAYSENPENKDLQSLVSLLKTFREKNKPTQAYKENIIRFIDRTTDFFLEKEMNETAAIFKESVIELAEYLLARA